MTDRGEPVPNADVESRLVALERTVATLEQRLAELGAATSIAARTPPSPRIAEDLFATKPARPPAAHRPTVDFANADPGQWAGRLGIALLLLGAVFGFKYSIDRGWIGPAMRVFCGVGLGAVLVALSTRLRTNRPGLSRLLAGGGIGSVYLSIYAAFAFYALCSHTGAVAAMSLVTALAWLLSVREDDAVVATLATGVGLATPFLLEPDSAAASGLVLYTSLVVAGASAVFAQCGWTLLMGTTAVGAWTVLALAASDVAGRGAGAVPVQAGVVFVAAATWGLAVARTLLSAANPSRWRPAVSGWPRMVPSASRPARGAQAHQLALAVPVAAMFVTATAWDLGEDQGGWVALAIAPVCALAAAWLVRRGDELSISLAATHASAAAVMVAFAASLLLGDDARRIALAAEGVALLAVWSRTGAAWPATVAQAFLAFAALETLQRLLRETERARAAFAGAEIADLAVILALVAASRVAPAGSGALMLGAAQVAALLWFQCMLGPLTGGATLVTAAWFANAVALVVAGLRADSGALRRAGAAVMALTMAKLFVLDLATVDPFWRIVVFAGFGVVLLGLGYAFPALWKRNEAADS